MILILSVAASFWPGVTMYDTVAQYTQVLNGQVDDWHPPIMVRLWQLLHRLAPATAPMFALQLVLYAAGFALIVGALARSGRWRAATATAILSLSPLLLGWQMVVLKDAQMLGALVLAIGIVTHYRFQGRKVPAAAAVTAAVLIGYATFVRANALFATVPLSALLLPTRKRAWVSLALVLGGFALVLGLTPIINHKLFKAQPSNVANTQPIFDLAAIAVDSPPQAKSVFTPSERETIVKRHCVKAFFWDPLGDPDGCSSVTDRLMQETSERLYIQLANAVVHHPIAYVRHRAAHWNSTERWLVPPGLGDAAPPIEAEPNDLGLGTPQSDFASSWQDLAAAEASTPLGWPIVWTFIALILLPSAWKRRTDPEASLALALVASALTLEASFLVISIASDLRYHLWSMTASALALILLLDGTRIERRTWVVCGTLLAAVISGGVIARASLPRAPDTYQAMIHSASG